MTFTQAMFGQALPLLWAAVLWIGWFWLGRRTATSGVGECLGIDTESRLAAAVGAAAVAGAFAFSFFAIGDRAPFPPVDNVDWLFYGLPAVMLLAIGEVFAPLKLRPVIWLVGAGLVSGLVGQNYVKNATPAAWAVLSLAVWALAGADLRASAGRVVGTMPKTGLVILGLTSAFLAASMEMHGSHLVMPFRAASVGLALLPLFGLMFLARGRTVPSSALTTWAVLLAGTTLAMYLYFPKFPLVEAVLIGVAPLRVSAMSGRLLGWKRSVVAIGLALIPLLTAFFMALVPFLKEMAEDNYGY